MLSDLPTEELTSSCRSVDWSRWMLPHLCSEPLFIAESSNAGADDTNRKMLAEKELVHVRTEGQLRDITYAEVGGSNEAKDASGNPPPNPQGKVKLVDGEAHRVHGGNQPSELSQANRKRRC